MVDRNYANGQESVRGMKNILGETLWTNRVLSPLLALSLEKINDMYKVARDSALAFGQDVSGLPRRLRWRTEGLNIVEGVRSF